MTTPVAWPTGLSKTRAARPQAGLLIVPKSKIKQQHGAVDEMAVLPGGQRRHRLVPALPPWLKVAGVATGAVFCPG